MANRETVLSETDLLEIVRLLRARDMTIPEIARRTQRSRAVIAAIKRRIGSRKNSVSRTLAK
jgi:hypothetical protein